MICPSCASVTNTCVSVTNTRPWTPLSLGYRVSSTSTPPPSQPPSGHQVNLQASAPGFNFPL